MKSSGRALRSRLLGVISNQAIGFVHPDDARRDRGAMLPPLERRHDNQVAGLNQMRRRTVGTNDATVGRGGDGISGQS